MASQEVEQIVSQYTAFAGLVDQMFREMGLRSEIEWWRYDGAGTCQGMTKKWVEQDLVGPAAKRLIELRELRNSRFEGKSTTSKCPYHRNNIGCVLKELKDPYCASHVDVPGRLKKTFGINGGQLMRDLHYVFGVILNQDLDAASKLLSGDVSMVDFSESANAAVSQIIRDVRRYPLLRPEDRRMMIYFRDTGPLTIVDGVSYPKID